MEFYEVLPQQHEVTVQSNGGDTDGIYNKDNDENQPKPVKQRLKVVMSLMLMPRSLLVFREDAYTVYKHGIPDSDIDLVDELYVNTFSTPRHNTPRHNTPQHSTTHNTQHNTQHNTTHNTTQGKTTHHNTIQHNSRQHSPIFVLGWQMLARKKGLSWATK